MLWFDIYFLARFCYAVGGAKWSVFWRFADTRRSESHFGTGFFSFQTKTARSGSKVGAKWKRPKAGRAKALGEALFSYCRKHPYEQKRALSGAGVCS